MRCQITECAVKLFGDLFLATEQELKLKFTNLQAQIERVYPHVSAKYVALRGIKNLTYLLWMVSRILSPPLTGRGALPGRIEAMADEATTKIIAASNRAAQEFNFDRADLDPILVSSL